MSPLPAYPRREALRQASHGFGLLALQSLLCSTMPHSLATDQSTSPSLSPTTHHPAKIRNVIFLFMDGGPSQVDTFDPKPLLAKEHGKPFPKSIDATQFDQNGTTFASPFKFHAHGQSGLAISELFPNLSRHADDLCIVRSMQAEFSEHSQACLFLHCGHPLQGRPSFGSWIGYGLGSENKNLPEYVVLNGGVMPIGGVENFSNAFLPATHQATLMDCYTGAEAITNIQPATGLEEQKRLLRFIQEHDQAYSDQLVGHSLSDRSTDRDASAVESAIRNYETASAMQLAVPELTDLGQESQSTQKLYGVDSPNPLLAQYARQCLLARRLVERGVRFVEVTCVKGIRFVAPWDDHEELEKGHRKNAEIVDQPIAALIEDLRSRGLLGSTLLVFAGEFGRTPFAQGGQGRDHNPQGFSIWLAGGGIRGGMAYGATDEFGYRAVENIVSIHDLHATILHLMGLDHTRLTYRWGGRDFRLTDVYGNVMTEWLS